MKKIIYIFSILTLFLLPVGCDLVDASDVHNPQITEEKLFEDASGGATPLLTGLKYQLANSLMYVATYNECISDNYDNTGTYLSSLLDKPRELTGSDNDLDSWLNGSYSNLEALRNLADFGLDVILPSDVNATPDDEARVHFYKGVCLLLLCENYPAFPVTEGGPLVNSDTSLEEAIAELNQSYTMLNTGDNAIACKAALARAYRLQGNKTSAVAAANDVLALSNDFLITCEYDDAYLQNYVNTFTVVRNVSYDMQPLPRLDFLDPKFIETTSAIPLLKAEEAYLILAEAAISDNNESAAKTNMINVLNLASTRATVLFTDDDPREGRGADPANSVKADAVADARTGLILDRTATLNIPAVSGTSLTEDYINGLSGKDNLYYALYLLRQEIFFSEGRRMTDLGIRLPVMNRQVEASAAVNTGDYGTTVIVPSYIPSGDEMDQFSISGNVITILHDMNRILVQNISEASPFE